MSFKMVYNTRKSEKELAVTCFVKVKGHGNNAKRRAAILNFNEIIASLDTYINKHNNYIGKFSQRAVNQS